MHKNEINIKNKKMKNAYIEQVIMWIVIFTGFVWMLFFVIDYASVIRVQDNMNALADYGASVIGISGTGAVDAAFIQNLNAIRVNGIEEIQIGDIICNSVVDGTFQVVFNIESVEENYKFYADKLTSVRVVFNETNSNTITCTLDVNLKN